MQYLDYGRLSQCADVQLHRFLVTVCQTDTKRRCQAAFPEFFDNAAGKIQILWEDLVARYNAVRDPDREDWESDIHETFNWFGIEVQLFEFREDGVPQKDYRLLPPDFKLERDFKYDGMTRSDRWLIEILKAEPSKFASHDEYLVLGITDTGDTNPKFFLWAVPTCHIYFD